MTDATVTEPGKIDIGRVISQTFSVLRRNFVTFFLLSLLLSALPAQILSYLQVTTFGVTSGADALNPAAIGSFLFGVIATVVTASVLQGALVFATVQDLNGRKPSVGECLATGLRAFLPLLGVSILFGLAIMGGMILLIVPGIMIGIAWCVCVPVLVAERTSVTGAFGRAGALTRGNRWRIFGLVVIIWIIVVVIGAVVGAVTVSAALQGDGLDPVALAMNPIQIALSLLVSTITAAIASTGIAVLYVELRRAREGTGPEWLADIFS